MGSRKQRVFPRILPMKMGMWLGAESNRRHVDFQSTALPTELPSRKCVVDFARELRMRVLTMQNSGYRASAPNCSGGL
jgi:hypothetical protein